MRRVVVTGMGGVTALGEEWSVIRACFERGQTGIVRMAEWERFEVRRKLDVELPSEGRIRTIACAP